MSAFTAVIPRPSRIPEIELFTENRVSKPREGYVVLFCFSKRDRECISLHVSLESTVRNVLLFIRKNSLAWPCSMRFFNGTKRVPLDIKICQLIEPEKNIYAVKMFYCFFSYVTSSMDSVVLKPYIPLDVQEKSIYQKWVDEEGASWEEFQIARLQNDSVDVGSEAIKLSCIFPRTIGEGIILKVSPIITVRKVMEYLKRRGFGWPIAAWCDQIKLLRDFKTIESIVEPGATKYTLWFLEDINEAPKEMQELIKARRIWSEKYKIRSGGCVIA